MDNFVIVMIGYYPLGTYILFMHKKILDIASTSKLSIYILLVVFFGASPITYIRISDSRTIYDVYLAIFAVIWFTIIGTNTLYDKTKNNRINEP